MKDWITIFAMFILAWTGWIVPVIVAMAYIVPVLMLLISICNLEKPGR